MRFPISDQYNLGPVVYCTVSEVGQKNRQNRQFVPTPVSEIALVRGDAYRIS